MLSDRVKSLVLVKNCCVSEKANFKPGNPSEKFVDPENLIDTIPTTFCPKSTTIDGTLSSLSLRVKTVDDPLPFSSPFGTATLPVIFADSTALGLTMDVDGDRTYLCQSVSPNAMFGLLTAAA